MMTRGQRIDFADNLMARLESPLARLYQIVEHQCEVSRMDIAINTNPSIDSVIASFTDDQFAAELNLTLLGRNEKIHYTAVVVVNSSEEWFLMDRLRYKMGTSKTITLNIGASGDGIVERRRRYSKNRIFNFLKNISNNIGFKDSHKEDDTFRNDCIEAALEVEDIFRKEHDSVFDDSMRIMKLLQVREKELM